jgi:hypothetical protein
MRQYRPSVQPGYTAQLPTCFIDAGLSSCQRTDSGTVLARRHTAPATTGDATLVPAATTQGRSAHVAHICSTQAGTAMQAPEGPYRTMHAVELRPLLS